MIFDTRIFIFVPPGTLAKRRPTGLWSAFAQAPEPDRAIRKDPV
jgi:hypothetical protein